MLEVVPNVARAYWRVLCAIVLCVLYILLNVVVGLLWEAITRSRFDGILTEDDDDRRVWWPGLFWVVYAVAGWVAVAMLGEHVASLWQIDLILAAAVLGVLPIYWAFPWSRPDEDRLIYRSKSADPPEDPKLRVAWPWRSGKSGRPKP